MKTFRERYEENYVAVSKPADNKEGFTIEYVYYAPWHIWNLPEEELNRKKRAIGTSMALSAVIFFIVSAQNIGVNTEIAVALSGILSICALIFEGLGVVQFCAAKYRTTRQNFDDVTSKIMLATLLHFLFLFAAAVGCVYYMVKVSFSASGLLAAIGYLISALLSIYIRTQYKSIPLKTEANTTLQEYQIWKDKTLDGPSIKRQN